MKTHYSLISLFILLFSYTSTKGQTIIKVGSEADSIAGTVQHKTIKFAYNNLSAPLTDAVIIELQSSYDPTLETYPITLGVKATEATKRITIRPAAGAKITLGPAVQTVVKTGTTTASSTAITNLSDTIGIKKGMQVFGPGVTTYNTTVDALSSLNGITLANTTGVVSSTGTTLIFGKTLTRAIVFNGADFVTIDGVSRTGDTQLTIMNPNHILASTILFQNDATYNVIKNCTIKGANITGTSAPGNGTNGVIYFSTGTTGNSFNKIDNNDICNVEGMLIPTNMISMANSSGSPNKNDTISNNNIYNFGSETYFTGINVGAIQFPSNNAVANTCILNNRFYWSKAITLYPGSNIPAIGCGGSYTGTGNKFEGNIMGYNSSNGTEPAVFSCSNGATFNGLTVSNFSIKDNVIAGISGDFNTFVGINIKNTTTIAADNGCYNNVVKDITLTAKANATAKGISITSATTTNAINIKNNEISNITQTSATATQTIAVTGIDATGAKSTNMLNYIGNKIYKLTAGNTNSTVVNTVYGIKPLGNTGSIEKNLIYDIDAVNNAATANIRGIQIEGSNGTTPIVVKNNILRLGTTTLGNPIISAFYQNTAATAADPIGFYHNSVYIGGTSTGAASYILNRNSTAAGFTIKNNIFSNKRSGNSSLNQIYYVLANTDIVASNNNLYEYNGQFASNGATGIYGDLANWKSTTNLEDKSIDNTDPLFKNPTATTPDLSLQTGTPADQAGTSCDVTDDFFGSIRSDYTPIDLGAIIYSTGTGAKKETLSQLTIHATSNGIVVSEGKGQKVSVFNITGEMVKSLVLSSDDATILLNKGLYVVKVGGKSTKVIVK